MAATVSSALPMLTGLLKNAACSVRCPLWISPFWEPGILKAGRSVSSVLETPATLFETENVPVEVNEDVHPSRMCPLHSSLEVTDFSSVDKRLI